jgi:hypothetical protein
MRSQRPSSLNQNNMPFAKLGCTKPLLRGFQLKKLAAMESFIGQRVSQFAMEGSCFGARAHTRDRERPLRSRTPISTTPFHRTWQKQQSLNEPPLEKNLLAK